MSDIGIQDSLVYEADKDYVSGKITWPQYQKVIERINEENNREREEDFYE